jgi:hypothetical protein
MTYAQTTLDSCIRSDTGRLFLALLRLALDGGLPVLGYGARAQRLDIGSNVGIYLAILLSDV